MRGVEDAEARRSRAARANGPEELGASGQGGVGQQAVTLTEAICHELRTDSLRPRACRSRYDKAIATVIKLSFAI
jgi:hypothetical protein